MKYFRPLLIALLIIQFSLSAFSNAESVDNPELRKSIASVQLKVKSETLKELLHEQWVINNLSSKSVDSLYIQNVDNPYVAAAIGFLASQGFISFVGSNSHNSPKRVISSILKSGHAGAFFYIYATALMSASLGGVYYVIVDTQSKTIRTRDKIYKKIEDQTIEKHYEELQLTINRLSQEIVALNKSIGN